MVILQYIIDRKWAAAIRAEHYQDKTGIMIPTNTPNGFQTTGISLNLDYRPAATVMWRVEGRWLKSRDDIFKSDTGYKNSDFFFVTSLAVNLEKK